MKERKVLHIEDKSTNKHYYFGALSTIKKYLSDFPYHTVKAKYYNKKGWENGKYKLRVGKIYTAFGLKTKQRANDETITGE